tara:strand:+ start:80 stop:235 length:156 start_codon:yes stop_codon:yes gene_type:complete
MIIFGNPIHRKYVKKIIIILLILGSVLLMSCDKLEFDPLTSTFRYILQEKK